MKTKNILLSVLALAGVIAIADPRKSMLAANESEIIPEGLPDGVVPVAYIESTGTQWIDTGYAPNGTETIKVVGAMTGTLSNSGLLGTVGASGLSDIFLCTSPSQGKYAIGWGSTIRFAVTPDSDFHVFESGLKRGFWIDGQFVAEFGSNSRPYGRTIALFCRDAAKAARGAIAAFSVPGALDLIAVRALVDDTWVGAMYDLVSESLFLNAGTGEFLIGPDI